MTVQPLVIPFDNPSIVRFPSDCTILEQIKDRLKYHDRRVEFELQKARKSYWLLKKLGEDGFQEHLATLKNQCIKSLVYQDEAGTYTLVGMLALLQHHFDFSVLNQTEYPTPHPLSWDKPPIHEARKYQEEAVANLLEARHACVEMGTGLGKSRCLLMIARQLGLKTVVMAPSISIANQLYSDFATHLGLEHVGLFGDGKRQTQKRFVIAIAASLAKVQSKSKEFEDLSDTKVFMADESHLCPADTLERVCLGLCKQAPYRFFFSGTQLRNDGLDLVLEGLTGPIVYKMDVAQGVDQGWLAKPYFRMFPVPSDSGFQSSDANEMTRCHLLYNPRVNGLAANIANKAVGRLGHQVLILIDEMEQFAHLLPLLQYEAGFAHGGVTRDNADKVPVLYQKSDPGQLVKRFNAGELPILIGTSCIGTGTDIRPVRTLIYLVGGKSEIQFRQAVGRGTRKVPGKDEFWFFDFQPELASDDPFDKKSWSVVKRHALVRAKMARGIYDTFKETRLTWK